MKERKFLFTKPACCNRVTPITRTIEQPKSERSADEGLSNCLPQAWLNYSVTYSVPRDIHWHIKNKTQTILTKH